MRLGLGSYTTVVLGGIQSSDDIVLIGTRERVKRFYVDIVALRTKARLSPSSGAKLTRSRRAVEAPFVRGHGHIILPLQYRQADGAEVERQ